MAVTTQREIATDPRIDDLSKKVDDGFEKADKKMDAGFARVDSVAIIAIEAASSAMQVTIRRLGPT